MKSTGGLDLHRQRSQEELDEDPQVKQLGECAKLYTKLEASLTKVDAS